jgi:nitroreductase
MNFLDLAKMRHSVRKYKDIPVEEEKLKYVLEAGRVAPSACNFQPWYFVVVDDEVLKKKVADTYGREWIYKAPVIIVACGDHSQSWHRSDGKDHCDIDVAISVTHMTLAAVEQGLGTCWVCAFDAKKCHDVLELPENIEVIALIPLGYPDDTVDPNRHTSKRKDLEQIVRRNG